MALSAKRKAARLFVLNHAAAWLEDIETTEIADDSEFDEELVIEESKSLLNA